MARTSKDRTIDRLLTAYIINECAEHYDVYLSETKLQKLVFLSELDLIRNRMKALNYNYIKFYHGPFSSSLRNDVGTFSELTLIDGPFIKSSSKLNDLVVNSMDIIEKNEEFIQRIDVVLDKYARMPLEDLLKKVYSMPWKGKTIGSLSLKTPMLYPLRTRAAELVFNLSEDELIDLSISFDKKINKELSSAFADLKEGRLYSHEEIFG